MRWCSARSAAPRRRGRLGRCDERVRRGDCGGGAGGGPEHRAATRRERRQRRRHEPERRGLERAPGADPAEPGGRPRANRDARPVALALSVGHAVAKPRPERHADPGALAQPGPERHADPGAERHADHGSPAERRAEPDSDADTGAEPGSEPDAGAHTDPDPNPDTDPGAHTDPDPNPDTDPGAHTDPDPNPDTDPGAHPTPTPTPTPEPSPSPSPTPIATISIAAARAAADGTSVTLEGVLSTPLGVLEAGRGGFLQDETAGIAIYAASALEPIAAGSLIRVAGSVDDRYGQRTVRLDGPPIVLAIGPTPFPVDTTTGAALEPLEGRRIRVRGAVLDTPRP